MIRLLWITVLLFCASFSSAQGVLMGADVNAAYGDTAFQNGDFDEAIRQYSLALVSKKSDPDLYYMRAQSYLQKNYISKAKNDLRRASRIGSYKSDLLLDSLLGRTGRDESREQFENDLERYLNSSD